MYGQVLKQQPVYLKMMRFYRLIFLLEFLERKQHYNLLMIDVKMTILK